VDKKWGATTARPGLQEAMMHARDGDVLVAHTSGPAGSDSEGHSELGLWAQGAGCGRPNPADPLAIRYVLFCWFL
jgi:hypothetical protein